MFTGIIRQIGAVKSAANIGGMFRLVISACDIASHVAVGDSVAVNGVCLTAASAGSGSISFDVMAETLERSTLKTLKAGDPVNLESAIRPCDPMGGHFVLGHVDCVSSIRSVSRPAQGLSLEIDMPEGYSHLIVEKGSVAVDGVSLTVAALSRGNFTVCLVSHTLKSTTLGSRRAGDRVNLEFDIIGKYIAGFKDAAQKSAITDSLLKKSGFA